MQLEGGLMFNMALLHSPSIVTEGLIFCIDAANRGSYSGSGSTWMDVSSNNRDGTLFNSPIFSSEFGGTLRFNDTLYQHLSAPNPGSLTRWTADAWVRITGSLTGKPTMIVGGQYDLVSNLNFSIGTNNSPNDYNICAGFFNGSWRNTTGFTPTLSSWYLFSGTYDGAAVRFYVNGQQYSSLSYVGTPQSGGVIRVARRWDESATNAINFLRADIPMVKVYNRALTPAEVLQNFNATKGRFNL